MMKNNTLNILKKSDGQSMVELAIILPVLLLLVFGVLDYSRYLLAQNIVVNMSREGANLASRTQESRQAIMTAIATTADPLDMGADGMIYITEVMGVDDGTGGVDPIVQNQYKYVDGGYSSVNSIVWDECTDTGEWVSGSCTNIPNDAEADLGAIASGLNVGQKVYAVEVFYDYTPLTGYVIQTNIKVGSTNVF